MLWNWSILTIFVKMLFTCSLYIGLALHNLSTISKLYLTLDLKQHSLKSVDSLQWILKWTFPRRKFNQFQEMRRNAHGQTTIPPVDLGIHLTDLGIKITNSTIIYLFFTSFFSDVYPCIEHMLQKKCYNSPSHLRKYKHLTFLIWV